MNRLFHIFPRAWQAALLCLLGVCLVVAPTGLRAEALRPALPCACACCNSACCCAEQPDSDAPPAAPAPGRAFAELRLLPAPLCWPFVLTAAAPPPSIAPAFCGAIAPPQPLFRQHCALLN